MPPPPDLGRLLVQIQYPGMTFVESDIARAWINRHGPEYDEISFNVRLGEGIDPGSDYADEIRRMARLVTQKRADMVARVGDQVDLVEVKVRIAFPVLGQLIGYRGLWEREHPELRVRRLIAIGRAVVPDMEQIIRDTGIEIELFPRVREE
ncbi:MAG: hypothetical protein K6W08_07390 [Firmicutes bacterium]|jgi:hypothetical protein|nr:hypothetical protein [Bacillota bacterium]